MWWVVDGNNVMGTRPDGWWNDRPAAQRRLTQAVADWCRHHDDDVRLVFDGKRDAATEMLAGGNLAVTFADSSRRNAADDAIVAIVAELYVDPDLTVVTADRGLIERLPPGVAVERPGRFLGRIDR